MHSEAIISHNLSLTAYRAYTTYTPILAPEGCLLEHLLEDGARSGVPRQAAGNRSPREARNPARRALGPGCEELAVTDPDASPVREARDRSPKSPRWSAERRASLAQGTQGASQAPGVPRQGTPTGCFARVPVRLSVLRPPLFPGERSEKQNPGAETRRGNEEVLFGGKAFSWSFRPRRDS